MEQRFEINPILNSPYIKPERHWQLDSDGKPTGQISEMRRASIHLVPIPASQRKRRQQSQQGEFDYEDHTKENPIINRIRRQVDEWREKPPSRWNVTHVTQKLLEHWRGDNSSTRPFFCQVEAAETLIWLNEVAPITAEGKRILHELQEANTEANPDLLRYAAKMATGAGKTTVMAMMIAYQSINKARQPNSSRFTHNFLIITPGITIKDRLRVLLPSDPNSLYIGRGIVPSEFIKEVKKARIVISNYHVFGHREKEKISKRAREILKGNSEQDLSTLETEGEMLQRACRDLLREKDVIVINDEAHHCYRHRKISYEETASTEDQDEIMKNDETARLWISGIEALGRRVDIKCVYDLSATPFFLRGSGYPEGQLFPWVTSDFALMDAIECGIVKLPRVPIDDGTVTQDNLPIYRNIYHRISKDLPMKGRSKQKSMNPENLPAELLGALTTLYGHYQKTFDAWAQQGIEVPPVFIIVCNNTSTSKLVYDHVSGYELPKNPGVWKQGAFELFNNVGSNGKPLPRMNTLLIDSEQLDSGRLMDDDFKEAAATEIQIFKNEMRTRFPEKDIYCVTDEDLLREVMNTVGKKNRLGEQIRCVVSVSMLTEGWDTNNVTHILGIRAFGTQLLCEQVIGRGLRRFSYDLEPDGQNEGLLTPEYADVFGVPFTFATGSKAGPPNPPKPQYRVRALEERSHLAISFPRVRSYTIKIPDEKLAANFDENSRLMISPEDAPPITEQQGIIGEGVTLTLEELKKHRMNAVVFHLAAETTKLFADQDGNIPPSRFRDLAPITRRWLEEYLVCLDGTFPQYTLWKPIAIKAAERIHRACSPLVEDYPEVYIPVIDKFTPEGSSFSVDFLTRRDRRHETRADKSHVNLAVCDSDWELSFCSLLENNSGVYSYVRNDGLGFEVPYIYKQRAHNYEPDFIALIDDGKGQGDLLNLIIEIKGMRDDRARTKADTMNRLWIPAVNNDGRWGRWAFVEIMDMQNAREALATYTDCATLVK